MNAEQHIKYLELELAKSRAEAAQLRKKIGEKSRHARRIQKAYEDALLLAMWWVSGIIPSRSYTKRQGMSQNRFQNATALLKMGRVIVRHRHWAIKDLAIIEQRLASARQRALDDPQLFFLRHPRHR